MMVGLIHLSLHLGQGLTRLLLFVLVNDLLQSILRGLLKLLSIHRLSFSLLNVNGVEVLPHDSLEVVRGNKLPIRRDEGGFSLNRRGVTILSA